jgi:urease gamma subunit
MERRKIIGAALFSAAIAGGGVAGVVLGSPASSSAASAPSTTSATGDRPGGGLFLRGPEGHGVGLDAAAKAIGITTDALLTELKDGKSIADVAKAKGVDVQKVIDAMVAAVKADFEANIEKRITDEVNGKFERPFGPGGPGGPHRGFGFRGGFGLDVAAKAIGVSTDSLLSDLKDGKTIADVAKAKGVDVQKVIDAMVAGMTKEIDAQVTAGRLTADQASRLKANLKTMITDQVNGTFHRPDMGGLPGLRDLRTSDTSNI